MKPSHPIRTTWTVACWEFQRYFKLKDQIVGLVSLLVGAAIAIGAVKAFQYSKKVELAVVGASAEFALPEKGNLQAAQGDYSIEQWKSKLDSREIGGLLIISAVPGEPWSAELFVRKEPSWISELDPLVQAERLRFEMQNAQIVPETLARVVTPVAVKITATDSRSVSKSDRFIAFCILGGIILTSWIGLAYMMTGITGEKQLRVTEQIVSAIRPQMWIDGKLLGITGASIGSLSFLLISGIVSIPLAGVIGINLPIPESLRRWEFLPAFIGFYFGGVMFWNYFYAAVSAVINDPNTSSRSALLFLPMLPMLVAALFVAQPDGMPMRVLSLFPATSATAMPMRMVLGEVGWLEIIGSFVFLIGSIALLRVLAGRFFAAGIMLYGKEPSWKDIASWTLGFEGPSSTLEKSQQTESSVS
jgi:ABC-2 type transport system permease protein